MDASTAPQSMVTRTVTLPIPLAEVGLFVGENDSSLMKFVVTKSQRTYVREHGSAGDDMPFVKVSVVVAGELGTQELYAECEAVNEELLNILEKSLSTHVQNYKRDRSGGKPKTDHKIARLVFKTNMDSMLIGKFIGRSGQNIKRLASELEQICSSAGITATGFRVNIMEEDPFKNSPNRFFYIKNDSGSDNSVIIFVTAQNTGNLNLRDLFLCIRDTMISSVVNCIESANQTHRRDIDDYGDDIYYPEGTCQEDSYA